MLYANAALQGALAGMQRALTVLRDERRVDEDPALVAPFAERQRLVGKQAWDALENATPERPAEDSGLFDRTRRWPLTASRAG